MKDHDGNAGRMSVRVRRGLAVAAVYGAVAIAGLAAVMPAVGQGTQQVSPANAAAADAAFGRAKALYDQGKYPEAQAENDKAYQLDPTNGNVLLLKRIIAEKLAAGPTNGGGNGAAAAPGKMNVLNPQQIDLVKMWELSPDDKALRGTVDRKSLEDFWQNVVAKDPTADTSTQAHDRFMNPSSFPDQVKRIKDSGDSKYMQQVHMTSDPAVMISGATSFKTVQSYMLQNCATSECHGGDKAGNFRLVMAGGGAGAPTAEQQLYTNFYIMAMYSNADGKMMNRDNPDSSLFLQYSLPKQNAGTPHPKVDIPRKLGGTTDPRFISMSKWVKTLAFPQPNYGIAYELPKGSGGAGTAPAPK